MAINFDKTGKCNLFIAVALISLAFIILTFTFCWPSILDFLSWIKCTLCLLRNFSLFYFIGLLISTILSSISIIFFLYIGLRRSLLLLKRLPIYFRYFCKIYDNQLSINFFESKILSQMPITDKSEDDFEFNKLLETSLIPIIKETKDLPVVFGITGPIGIGKSSFLNLTMEAISELKDSKILCFNFKPFIFDSEKNFFSNFLTGIKNAFQTNNIPTPDALLNQWKISVLQLGIPISLGIQFSMEDSNTNLENLKEELGNWLCNNNLKLVIFIDDLDRCSKQEIWLTFILVRHFANIKNIFFIIAYSKEELVNKFDTDIFDTEKFVDIEIPINIEANEIYKWFRKKLISFISDQYGKSYADQVTFHLDNPLTREYFSPIFNRWCNTIRKAKAILNDFALLYPIVSDKVFIPHFLIVLMMQHELPKLYAYLSEGGYYILYESYDLESAASGEDYLRYRINTLLTSLSSKTNSEIDNIFVKNRILEYLNALCGFLKTSEPLKKLTYTFNSSTEKINKFIRELGPDNKYIWDKNYTRYYFLFNRESYCFTAKRFEDFLSAIQLVKKQKGTKECLKFINEKLLDLYQEGLFKDFMDIVEDSIYFLFSEDSRTVNLLLKALSQLTQCYPYCEEVSKLIIILASSDKPKKKLNTIIKNIKNPAILNSLLLRLEKLKKEFGLSDAELQDIKKQGVKQYNKIFLDPLKCFCHFNLPRNYIEIFKSWNDAEKIAEYLRELMKSSEHKEHANEIIQNLAEASNSFPLFRFVLKKLNIDLVITEI